MNAGKRINLTDHIEEVTVDLQSESPGNTIIVALSNCSPLEIELHEANAWRLMRYARNRINTT